MPAAIPPAVRDRRRRTRSGGVFSFWRPVLPDRAAGDAKCHHSAMLPTSDGARFSVMPLDTDTAAAGPLAESFHTQIAAQGLPTAGAQAFIASVGDDYRPEELPG